MADISLDEIKKLAKLSRIYITDEEAEAFRGQITEILKYVEQLSGVDTQDIEPTSQVTGLENVMRPDEVKDYGVSRQALLNGTPQSQGNYIKTKRVL